jgi:hypothetical protein
MADCRLSQRNLWSLGIVCFAQLWIGTFTVQLVSRGNAAVQFFDLFNSYTMNKVLHADMQLSTPAEYTC